MSELLLDTSAVIGLVERNSASIRAIVAADDVTLYMSIVTLGELEHGVAAARTPAIAAARRASLRALSGAAEVAGLSALEASTYGTLSHDLRQIGFGSRVVGVADRWIAATAIARQLTLVTQDRPLAQALAAALPERTGLVLLAAT